MPNSDNKKAGCYGAKGGVFNSCFPLHEDSPDQAEKDRSCWLRIPRLGIRLNPIVTLLSMTVIWGFVAWGITNPDDMEERLAYMKTQITEKFTWFYISTKAVWVMFVICLYFSKYSKMKLGKEGDLPDYSTATWFIMLFSGVHGGSIYYFSVAEPIWHYSKAGGGNRFIADGYMPDNTLAQWAMNVTFYHWGFHGWATFCVSGLAIGFISYHYDLPLTMKSCFFPVLGDKIYGWMGDIIDTISVISTICGLSSLLGFASMQINTGLQILDPNISETLTAQLIIIWGLTSVATVSALTGIRYGIRNLSRIAFISFTVIMLIVFFLSETWYLLNLFVQSVGSHFQWILQQSFHTDAFEQIGPSAGGTARGRNFPDGSSDGPEDWMDNWSVFYWGWWVAYAPFTAVFLARISKGRTIREFIMGVMSAPVLLTLIWMTIFGGIGINMERNAAGIGLCCDGNFNKSVNATWLYADNSQSLCENEQCNPCAQGILSLYSSVYQNDSNDILYHFNDKNFGMTLPNKSVTRLSCRSSTEMWFDVMNSFEGLGKFLSGLSTVGLMSSFITSSDGASFMVDCLAANGERNPPRIQRAFWAITEGATATALIWYGGDTALGNLQTINIIGGFPFHILICIMCVSLWRALAVISGDLNSPGPNFSVTMFDVFAEPTPKNIGLVLLNIIIAPYSIAKVIVHTGDNKWKKYKLVGYTIVLSLLLIAFILLHVAVIWVEEIWAVAWVCYLMFTVAGGAARVALRYKYKINGNIIEDMLCSILLYPVSAWQISDTIEFPRQPISEDREEEMHSPKMHSGGDHSHLRIDGTDKLETINQDLTIFCERL